MAVLNVHNLASRTFKVIVVQHVVDCSDEQDGTSNAVCR